MRNRGGVDIDLSALCIPSDSSIRQAIKCIDRNAHGIAIVVDEHGRLIDTITDGDIRRAILDGVNQDLPVQELKLLKQQNLQHSHPAPLTAPVGTPDSQLLQLMNQANLRHIPILDEEGRVVDLALLSELARDNLLPITAVVMAGGDGTRLRPLTEGLPKPMLPLGDQPLLERIIKQLRQAGILRVNLTTRYKGEEISRHFGDGQDFGVEIRYVEEDQPLGTAGALARLEAVDEPLIVINGDILTRLDFRAMLDFHWEHQADMTIAVWQYEHHIPYGVIETDGITITGISEKPVVQRFINAGIYMLSPRVLQLIPNNQRYDMTDLISRLIKDSYRVVSFPFSEYWLDVGQHADYERAERDLRAGKV